MVDIINLRSRRRAKPAQFELSRRRDSLSWSHHREVAADVGNLYQRFLSAEDEWLRWKGTVKALEEAEVLRFPGRES